MAIVLACWMTVFAAGCKDKKEIRADEVTSQGVAESIATDKAAYRPGEIVKFSLQLKEAADDMNVYVRYRHLGEKIGDREVKVDGNKAVWEWTPPSGDFTGYMAEVFVSNKETVLDHLNIAVDVSSDWSKFPRYGYLADFPRLGREQMAEVIERLNRYHINGIQFYDWQYKHHDPLKMDGDKPATAWKDIANRPVSFDTVKGYIDLAHSKNIKAMNYNLLFGAYADADKDGVKKEWGLFKDRDLVEQDKHPLPGWASDIMLYDPANPEWQNYLIDKEKGVFRHLPFDGWHVDQLGGRGTLWNAAGEAIELPQAYVSFLKAAKQQLDVHYVMNAVSQFGQGLLASMAPLDFLYTEVWSDYPEYRSLKEIIDRNSDLSGNRLNTVLAAYVNYEYSNSGVKFNAPGVLLADAVIFASGGAHLELGENMLSKEYFPYKKLFVSPKLEAQLIRYYDFLTAYQNVLRDGLEETNLNMESVAGGPAISSVAKQGNIWSFAKKKNNSYIVHFINFTDATTMNWNDNEGNQAEPKELQDVTVSFRMDQKVKDIQFASPDYYNGSMVSLPMEQKDGQVTIKLPKLKYWDMMMVNLAE